MEDEMTERQIERLLRASQDVVNDADRLGDDEMVVGRDELEDLQDIVREISNDAAVALGLVV